MAAALVKFNQGDCRFDDRATCKLMDLDSRPVLMLPDEFAPFHIGRVQSVQRGRLQQASSLYMPRAYRLEISYQRDSFCDNQTCLAARIVIIKLVLQLVQ